MPNDKSATTSTELQALKAENARLKARNADLYRDCVAFAKLIKTSAKKEEQIDELQKEIIMLRSQLETLKQTQYSNFTSGVSTETYSPVLSEQENEPEEQYEDISSNNDNVTYNPRVHYIDQETFEQQNMELEDLTSGKPAVKKEKKAKAKTSLGKYKFAKVGVSVLLALSILISVISGVSYLFSTTYKDYTVMGYRFASVLNNSMMPDINMSDAVLIKYCGFEGLEIDSLVATTKDTRSLAKITDLAVSDGVAIATVEDKTGTYEINEDEFIGKVNMTIPLLGSVVRYASANSYNYMAIIVSLNLFLVACLLLIPSDKPKQPKFGKDYTAADFTI